MTDTNLDAGVEVLRDVLVPMRDGVNLAADIYLAADRRGPVPALMTRTAYNKTGALTTMSNYVQLAARGFAVVVQDKRGRHKSEGTFTLLRDDSAGTHQDGYDTAEWIAAQEWCNGSVGAFGVSYLGHTTMGAAVAAPPSLRAGVSMQPSSDEYTDRTFVDGVLNLSNIVFWATSELIASSLIDKLPADERPSVQADLDLYRALEAGPFGYLPLIDMPFVRRFPMLWHGPLLHREDPGYFAENRVREHEAERIAIPIEHVGGWWDPFARNTVRHYEVTSRYSRAKGRQRLVMGPWVHGGFARSSSADVEFPDSATDLNALVAEWMNTWIEASDENLSGPAAYLYVLGVNRWRAESAWPIPGTVLTPAYLGADGSIEFTAGRDGVRTYDYDPNNPYEAPGITDGMKDLSAFHTRDNLVIYTSAPLREELEITGWPRAVLYASTTATDGDLLVELHVVGTDGVARLFNEGIARARYRTRREDPHPVEPNTVTEYVVELRPISIILREGERLKVVVTGGKFPVYERNPNAFVDLNLATADDFIAATVTIHSGSSRASRIELPVVPADRRGHWVENPWPLALDR